MQNNLLYIIFTLFCILTSLFSSDSKTPYKEGKVLYEIHCASCHGKSGEVWNRSSPLLLQQICCKTVLRLLPVG